MGVNLVMSRCSGFGKSGCKTCKAAGVECIFPESQKRGYHLLFFVNVAKTQFSPHKGYFETISTVYFVILRFKAYDLAIIANRVHAQECL